jgi:RNA polymerase sigma factor (sigma-70 family)
MGDWELLQAYANSHSEAAFAELVRHHLDWVYSVALRHVGDPQLAEDVVQSVFVLLARKARELRPGTLLGGWLFRTTCHVAAHARRAEQRRKSREATACTMSQDTAAPDTDEMLWEQLAPHLDQAVAALPQADRSAVLLRFYEKMPLRQVGEQLGVSEEAAKKRVSRAVEKMRDFLNQRGVKLTGIALAAFLAEKTVQAASASLAGATLKISMAAASASASTLLPQLAQETLRAWHLARLKLAAGLGAASLAVLFVAVTAGSWVNRHAAAQSVAVNGSPRAEVAKAGQPPDREAPPAPAARLEVALPRKTGALTGSVVDSKGHPIAGAKVRGGFCSQPYAQDTTDQFGQFALDKVAAPAVVTVTADGYAADQQGFDPTNTATPLVFRLSPVRPLFVRLVDEAGRGVEGERLFLQEWWGRAGTLGQYLETRTDADGRLQWLSPPKGELQLSFGHEGYRYSRTNKITADGKEHVIVLHPVGTVTGSVTDAETGAPVPSFKYTLGHSQPWMPSDPIPMWDLRSQTGSNGSYQVTLEEEQVPYLRVEAAGYEAVEAQLELTNGLVGVRDFPLRRVTETNSIRGIVLLPDGSPAAGVEVALCTAKVGVMLNGTAFEPRPFGSASRGHEADYRRKTDADGAFSFEPKPGAHTLVAVSRAGLARVRCFDHSQPLQLKLQPWGRVEGNVRTPDGRWAERKLSWGTTGNLTSWMTLFYNSGGFSAQSDATGHFILERVPPGDCQMSMADADGGADILSPSLHVNAGGLGSPVTGKLVAPPGLEIRSWSNQVTLAQMHIEWGNYYVPKELTGSAVERWKLEFEDTDAGRKWFRSQWSYDFKVGADGSFTIPEALPGKYRLFVNVGQGYLGSGSASSASRPGDPQIAFAGMEVTVPEVPTGGGLTVELGEILLNPTR